MHQPSVAVDPARWAGRLRLGVLRPRVVGPRVLGAGLRPGVRHRVLRRSVLRVGLRMLGQQRLTMLLQGLLRIHGGMRAHAP
ncbi:hypothetical protein GCM10027055_11920 [Janibacter alkaliphilus]